MTLRYPADGYSGDTDYVTFEPVQYTSRGSGGGGAGGGQRIMLYMPEQLPGVSNRNAWGRTSFGEGPKGELARTIAGEITNAAMQDMTESVSTEDMVAGIDRIKGKFDALGSSAQPIIKQGLLDFAAKALPEMSASQALSVTQGKIYNPNIELAYSGPSFRTFSFRFRMVPKSASETAAINNIIAEFKRWSSPEAIEGGMYEIPYVWNVTYMTGGGRNSNQTRFKPAACNGITVQDNASQQFYSAHKGGAPIETSLTVSFQEVDIITRKDHTGMRGM